jgi:hypothetical protein
MTDAQPQGFLAIPPTGKGPGVLVLHAWWSAVRVGRVKGILVQESFRRDFVRP